MRFGGPSGVRTARRGLGRLTPPRGLPIIAPLFAGQETMWTKSRHSCASGSPSSTSWPARDRPLPSAFRQPSDRRRDRTYGRPMRWAWPRLRRGGGGPARVAAGAREGVVRAHPGSNGPDPDLRAAGCRGREAYGLSSGWTSAISSACGADPSGRRRESSPCRRQSSPCCPSPATPAGQVARPERRGVAYRQRYVDLIANPAVAEVFRRRARIVAEMRRFLDARGSWRSRRR